MDKTQMDYAKAKALFETLKAERLTRLEPNHYLLEADETIEQFVDLEMAVEAELGYTEAREALWQTEEAMLAWARGKVEKLANAEQKATLEYLFDKERFWRVRPQIVELSFHLNA